MIAVIPPPGAYAQGAHPPAATPAAPPDTTRKRVVDETQTEIENQKKELESLGRELEDRRAKSKQLRGRERNLLGELKEKEVQLSLTIRYIAALGRRRKIVSSDLGDATSELARTAVQLDGDRRRLAWRLREIYKRGRSRDIEYLLSARTFPDLVNRTYFLAKVAREDKNQMMLTQAHRNEVQDTKVRLEERQRELDRLKNESERQRRSQKQLASERRQLLTQIRGERKSNEQAATELERASKRIQALIGELEKRRLAAERGAPGGVIPLFGDFSKNKGRLPWPVMGKVVGQFGYRKNPRFNTATYNSGIDIATSFGTPIAAVSKARVDYVSWLDGYGKCAILNHGGGFYTLYAHASEILVAVGKEVAAGEIIGRVGDTGSTVGTALHFEIRQGKTALDPLAWFR
ncbi:MAG TPA: peptidoglycan DD-metalloendopeptidase family protein [Candidatus Limnocylindrales bacterium]|nr:peptidoglycan DD-metalloendopeptidase family protein [Candidatus Limnocylindrales bacterium]